VASAAAVRSPDEVPAVTATRFDHAAIAVRDRMDEAQAAFARLGFTLTPRGHHTLGSINHLIVLGRTYLELIGFPPGQPDARPELRDAPIGLNGLVFRSDDAQRTHDACAARGAPVTPVQSFSRPVALDGETREARFRTVRTMPGASPCGRLYFCEHLTPELVWRPRWQAHENGALELLEAKVSARDPVAEARLYRALLGEGAVETVADGALRIPVPPAVVCVDRGPDRMLGLTLRVADLRSTQRLLAARGVDTIRAGGVLQVAPSEAFDVTLWMTE
jgi:hypothetical protein